MCKNQDQSFLCKKKRIQWIKNNYQAYVLLNVISDLTWYEAKVINCAYHAVWIIVIVNQERENINCHVLNSLQLSNNKSLYHVSDKCWYDIKSLLLINECTSINSSKCCNVMNGNCASKATAIIMPCSLKNVAHCIHVCLHF